MKKFAELYDGHLPDAAYFCPGRVNLIGEHIDYNGGLVLPAAISLGITAHIRKNGTRFINLCSDHSEVITSLSIDALPDKTLHWTDYVVGVLHSLHKKELTLEGCDVYFTSTLPQGSGLSSSAALEVLSYYMFSHFFSAVAPERVAIALECQQIENNFIGVNCGIMDQFAVAMGKANHALLLNCSSLDYEEVPVSFGKFALLIINSNAPRTLATSAYNARRIECDGALAQLRTTQELTNLVDATLSEVDQLYDELLQKRARHVVSEQQRVMDSVVALKAGKLEEFGKLLNASHASLRDDYEVSSAQLDFIVNASQHFEGCLGARLTGAGFGGCCIALIEERFILSLRESLVKSYSEQFNLPLTFYPCKISDGVHALTI